MLHNQAISYVNEIKTACDTMSAGDIQLIEIKRDMQFAIGYTILIPSFLNNVRKHQVTSIADKYSLAMKEMNNGLLIYQPRKSI